MTTHLSEFFYYKDNNLYCEDICLKDIVQHISSPAFIYSSAHLKKQYHLFKAAFSPYFKKNPLLIAFAVKSCPNIHILKLLQKEGAGADIVSMGEMKRALKAGISPQKIMFSGVGKSDEEIAFALDNDIGMLNVESFSELLATQEIACKKNKIAPVSLRVNPDVTATTLPGISTGKKGDKFGISIDQIPSVAQQTQNMSNIYLKGIDFHIGSQILDVTEFKPAFEKIRTLIDILYQEYNISLEHIDCGGGLGVPYHPNDPLPDLDLYASLVHQYFGDLPVTMAFEPGRFISANSALLLSQILHVKQDLDDWQCLVMDAGMNDLARPAIYGAYHHIIPLQDSQKQQQAYDIVGPICETTDIFAKKYMLPSLQQKEHLAFMSAGAYGASMASNYNSRLDATEVLVSGNQYQIIKKRPTYEDIFALEENISQEVCVI